MAAADNDVAIFCYGTVAGGFLGERWLGAARAAAAAREPLARQVQADHRRVRRLGAVPGPAAALLEPSPRAMAPTSPPWPAPPCWRGPACPPSSSARATAPISPPTSRIASLALGADDMATIDAVLAPLAASSTATSTRWSATRTGRHGSIMKYNLNSEGKATAPRETAQQNQIEAAVRQEPAFNREGKHMKKLLMAASVLGMLAGYSARRRTRRIATSPSASCWN